MKKFLSQNCMRALLVSISLLLPHFAWSQPSPLVKLTQEGNTVPVNAGTLPVVFTKSANIPAPTGNVAPVYSGSDEDAFDFGTTIGNYYVESTATLDGLKNLSAFTLTGWLNAASLTAGSGGNRIISWINNGGDGVDLVLQNNGSLRLGVDGWPDGSPAFSSANKVAANPAGPRENWVFFAVTYQSNGQVRFYFGNDTNDATLDVTRTYSGPGVTGSSIGKLAFGAFNDRTRNSSTWDRMFRGILDDLRIYGTALTATDIIHVQRNTAGDTVSPTVPANVRTTFVNPTSIGVAWDASSDNIGVTGYEIYDGNTPLASIGPFTTYTVNGLSPNTVYRLSVRSMDAAHNYSAFSPELTISTTDIPSTAPLIYMPLHDIISGSPSTVGAVTGMNFTTGIGPSNTFLPSGSLETPPYVGGDYSADFGVTPTNAFIESQAPIDLLKNMSAFTITGWVNCKSSTAGSGGNRIVSWINNGGDGVDLVYQSNGSLRLGVDGWPDNSPAFSNPNKVTTNSAAPESNWVFFAVTYQSNGQVQFYFGTNTAKASLDVTRTYAGPGITGSNIGKFAIGAFNSATRNPNTYDRMFRGLIDDIRVFNGVLSLSNIIGVQGKSSSDTTSPTAPTNLTATSKTVSSISLSWTPSTDDSGIDEYKLYNNGSIVAHIHTNLNTVSSFTLTNLTPNTTYNLTIKASDASGNLSAASNSISVTTDATGIPLPVIDVKFEENAGASSLNEGTALASFVRSSAVPSASTNVPNVPNDIRSADFGTVTGDNYISSYLPVGELSGINSFTLTGWLNNRSSTTGTGGNRVISWINNGGDGVDLVYQSDGSLRLGVDEFAGNSPAVSSPNKITTEANAGSSNWVFFAVTYQSNGQVQFYFGNNASDATLDVTRTYAGRGAVGGNIGKLAFGAFNDNMRSASTYQNMFRGIIDNFKIYGSSLSLADIRAVQRGVSSDATPPSPPSNLEATENTGTLVFLSWDAATDNVAVADYNVYNGTTLLQTTQGPYNSAVLSGLTPGENYQFTVKARDAANNLSAASNVLNLQTRKLPLVYVPLGAPTPLFTQSNLGTLAGSLSGTSTTVTAPSGGAPYALNGTLSGPVYDGLKNLNAFTIMGWVNKTSNVSSERILGWMPNGGGEGVELLLQSDGRLRLGVDGVAESSPAVSSANKITTAPSAPESNWVFFALTYQSNGQTQFYFGNNTNDASPDVTVNYVTPGITGSNISNFYIKAPSGGFIDEIRVFGSVLSLQEIIALQRGPTDTTPPSSPGTLSVVDVTETTVRLQWSDVSTDNVGVTSYDVFNNNTFVMHHVPDIKNPLSFTSTMVSGLTPNTTYNLSVRARDSNGNYSPATNTVQATTLGDVPSPLVWLKLDEASGSTTATNSGTAASNYTRSSVKPASSANVPTGIGSLMSLDYGTVAANAFVESTAPVNELKNLSSFTITGWVNNRSSFTGSGGNRIVSWINNGGEGVDLVYQNNGSLRMGVDGWPDSSPAYSSPNKISTNASAPATNWVFFAVTYVESGAVQFYFGSTSAPASLDVTKNYPGRGAAGSNIANLAIGNFNAAARSPTALDRVFRGLIDDVRIYGSVLTQAQIAEIQGVGGNSGARLMTALPESIIQDEFADEGALSQNYPNPFDAATNIEVNVPHSVRVAQLSVIDVTGRSLQNIVIEGRGPTSVTVSGDGMTSGVYIYRLTMDGNVVGFRRMIVRK